MKHVRLANIKNIIYLHGTMVRAIIGALLVIMVYAYTHTDLYAWYVLNKANTEARSGNIDTAKELYGDVARANIPLSYLGYNNRAILEYKNMEYEQAYQDIRQAVKSRCRRDGDGNKTSILSITGDYCADVLYNMGNILYRLGEGQASGTPTTTDTVRTTMWSKAIASYQQDITLRGKDALAQENIDFILKKMQSSSSSSKQTQSQDSKKGNKNTSQKQDGGGGTDGKKGKTGQKSDTTQSGTSKEESRSGKQGKQGEQAGGTKDSRTLDPQTSARVDNYMRQLDQRARKYQGYFNQSGKSRPSQQRNGFFNDPFFGRSFTGTSERKSLERDW